MSFFKFRKSPFHTSFDTNHCNHRVPAVTENLGKWPIAVTYVLYHGSQLLQTPAEWIGSCRRSWIPAADENVDHGTAAVVADYESQLLTKMLTMNLLLSQIMETAVDWQLFRMVNPSCGWNFRARTRSCRRLWRQLLTGSCSIWWIPAVAEMSSTNVAKCNL